MYTVSDHSITNEGDYAVQSEAGTGNHVPVSGSGFWEPENRSRSGFRELGITCPFQVPVFGNVNDFQVPVCGCTR